jgi:hypothetical protein
VATTITFDHDLDYLDTSFGWAPALLVTLGNPQRPGESIDALGFLDTGAQRTLFDGELTQALGIDIFSGRKQDFSFTQGGSMSAHQHEVVLSHPALGRLSFPVCFSLGPIHRNLFGRDFLELLQVGFRQYDQMFFLSPRR